MMIDRIGWWRMDRMVKDGQDGEGCRMDRIDYYLLVRNKGVIKRNRS